MSLPNRDRASFETLLAAPQDEGDPLITRDLIPRRR
jgi:hypothetical protein